MIVYILGLDAVKMKTTARQNWIWMAATVLAGLTADPAQSQEYSEQQIKDAKVMIKRYSSTMPRGNDENKWTINNIYVTGEIVKYRVIIGDLKGASELADKGIRLYKKFNFVPKDDQDKESALSLIYYGAVARGLTGENLSQTYSDLSNAFEKMDFYLEDAQYSPNEETFRRIRNNLYEIANKKLLYNLEKDYKNHPNNQSIFDKALDLSKSGDHKGAAEQYSQAIADAPDSYLYWGFRGVQKWAFEDSDGAISDGEHALQLTKSEETGWIHRYLGNAYAAKKQFGNALEHFDLALKNRPWDQDVRWDRQKALWAQLQQTNPQAQAKYDATQYLYSKAQAQPAGEKQDALCKAAFESASEAIRLSPQVAFLYHLRAITALCGTKTLNTAQAVADGQMSLRLDPESTTAYYGLARAYDVIGWEDTPEYAYLALKYYRITALRTPNFPGISKLLGDRWTQNTYGSSAQRAKVAAKKAQEENELNRPVRAAVIPTQADIIRGLRAAQAKLATIDRVSMGGAAKDSFTNMSVCNRGSSAKLGYDSVLFDIERIQEDAERRGIAPPDWLRQYEATAQSDVSTLNGILSVCH